MQYLGSEHGHLHRHWRFSSASSRSSEHESGGKYDGERQRQRLRERMMLAATGDGCYTMRRCSSSDCFSFSINLPAIAPAGRRAVPFSTH